MKRFFRNYLTQSEEKLFLTILFVVALAIFANNNSISRLYSQQVSVDSLKKELQTPYEVKFDIRSATIQDLTQIKGIGIKTATNIIEYRDQHKIESNLELINIKGIGEKTLSLILPYLVVIKDSTSTKPSTTTTNRTANKSDINSASITDLCKVKGIGEKRGQQIIALRNELKGFDRWEQLLQIKGIGKKTLAKIEVIFFIGKKR